MAEDNENKYEWCERYACNGALSHYALIDTQCGTELVTVSADKEFATYRHAQGLYDALEKLAGCIAYGGPAEALNAYATEAVDLLLVVMGAKQPKEIINYANRAEVSNCEFHGYEPATIGELAADITSLAQKAANLGLVIVAQDNGLGRLCDECDGTHLAYLGEGFGHERHYPYQQPEETP